ncbi:tetratricopeptide repeat-containing sulfotransferase family protein [Colwellia piezophila]|uniref:tetratricopeptide repeat-containing sulfotransferase family protein n=1 Tax=Colwellia piezophila TaxID=211668 RepID=UPI00036258EB|nr:sulfotransferase [Colwellia piezophila]
MKSASAELSQSDKNLIIQCKNLFSNNKILEARQKVSVLLKTLTHNKALLELAFNIELRCQDFAKAGVFLDLLSADIASKKEQHLLLISLLEAQEEHFKLLAQIELYIKQYDGDVAMRFKHGIVAMAAGKIELAEQSFLTCISHHHELPHLSLNLGHIYKAKGDSSKAVSYYRQFVSETPAQCGVGYWSLADLKDFSFLAEDKAKMEQLLADEGINIGNKALLNFALARACEQQQDFALAFKKMSAANNTFARYRPFKQELFAGLVNSMIRGIDNTFTKTLACENFTPIFIVGMPRSGTTLVEQILASHSKVVATDELQYIERIGLELEKSGGYVTQLKALSNEKRQEYSQSYCNQVQQYFTDYQPIVIDKNPNNFLHIGLIKALFPNAKIINVIRNPLDNGLSVFKQYFSRGHEYSYSMEGIMGYWQGYLALMHHWKKTFGQDIYHLSYEGLTENPETEIRKLLNYCQLTFEADCLTFYKSDRVVLTPSVSQVKQPINRRSVNSWQKYEQGMTPFLPRFESIIKQANALLD